MKRFFITLALVSLSLAPSAFAQPVRNDVERAQNERALQHNVAEQRDDLRDLARLEALLTRHDEARRLRSIAGLDAVDRDLRDLLAMELAEARREQRKSDVEVARSEAEERSSARELRRDVRNGAPPVVVADDHRDLIDDDGDRRKDQRDASFKASQWRQRVAIARELDGLFMRQAPRAVHRKHDLLVELIQLARADVAQNASERIEDRREHREDRVEAVEDFRRP